MRIHKITYYGAALVSCAGWFLALSSHAFHESRDLASGVSHTTHIVWGVIIALVGLAAMIAVRKKA